MGDLTGRQREILELIRRTVQQRGYPPSVREIGAALGLSSPSTVHSHLSALVKLGYLRRDPSKPRAIEVVDAGGATSPRTGVRDVPLVGSGPVFMLRVRGDSMVEAGILEGDYVVVRQQPDAEDGEIVAVLVGGEEATIKRLQRRQGKVVLLSDNPAYQPMVFEADVQLLGKVVSVLRSVR